MKMLLSNMMLNGKSRCRLFEKLVQIGAMSQKSLLVYVDDRSFARRIPRHP
jgi:hypothetical protein